MTAPIGYVGLERVSTLEVASSLLRSRRAALAASLLATLGVAGWIASGVGQAQLARGFSGLASVAPIWLWLAGLAFVGSLVASSAGWRSCLRPCGFTGGLGDACVRYGMGSLANSLLPARLGDVVRVGLFSRRMEGAQPLWRSGGGLVGVEVARAIVFVALFGSAAIAGALPLWPVLALAGVATAGLAAGAMRHRRLIRGPFGQMAEALASLAQSPWRLARVVCWMAIATGFRLLAVCAIVAPLGVHSPLGAGLIALAALELAGVFPLTPGNVGIASGAVALALHMHGVGLGQAVTIGIAFHAVETIVGLSFGSAALLRFAGSSSVGAHRYASLAGSALPVLVLLAGMAATGLHGDFA